MNQKPLQLVPFLVMAGAIVVVAVLRVLPIDTFERWERMTYDMRVRAAARSNPAVATNLGFVYIDENTITAVRKGAFGYSYGLYWPRSVYGRMVQELADEGAKLVAFDVLFGERRGDHPPVHMADDSYMESDDYLGLQMRRASNVVLATTTKLRPPLSFQTNALAIADIETEKDADGILRRTQAFREYTNWHWAFLKVEEDPDYNVDLREARVEPRQIILPRGELDAIPIPLDEHGEFDLRDFGNIPEGMNPKAKPFTIQRVWHMGIVLAAERLGLDLEKAEVDLRHGRITLRNNQGLTRIIPVDQDGSFLIDWSIPPNHPGLTQLPAYEVLRQQALRNIGQTNGLSDRFRDKTVIIGSSALANDLTDRGATPLRKDSLLVSKHWNVANSILLGRFIRRFPWQGELAFIVAFGWLGGMVSRKLRASLAVPLVVISVAAYVAVSFGVYIGARYWFPVVLPVAAALFSSAGVLSWRVIFEEAEQRRVRSVFSKMVSPKIVNELLAAETLSLGGANVEITVFFADVRGFTELTVKSTQHVADYIRDQKLEGSAAQACYDQQARETLEAVNTYLALVANVIKKNDGTLDKFIGDCVMAFWGAPTGNPRHALACVQAAIEAQRAVHDLNLARQEENRRREHENESRVASQQRPLPLLPILSLGSGINTGPAMAGLMGSSEAESMNYTVFGREVNLASRLEGASGYGRIFIGETTYQHLRRDAPELAATCTAQAPVQLKGFAAPVSVYEVPWKTGVASPRHEPSAPTAAAASPASTEGK